MTSCYPTTQAQRRFFHRDLSFIYLPRPTVCSLDCHQKVLKGVQFYTNKINSKPGSILGCKFSPYSISNDVEACRSLQFIRANAQNKMTEYRPCCCM